MVDIITTLKKLQALAGGTSFEFEREAAIQKIRDLMEAHGISEQDLNDSAATTYEFKYHGERERLLLGQIFYKVMGEKYTTYRFRRGGRKIAYTVGLDCTAAQRIEVEFLFDFYRDLYRREEQRFYHAFVQKHRLFGETPEGYKSKMTDEEMFKMGLMMEGMEDATPHKQLTGNAE